jgi:hypothetical protein
MKWQKLNTIDSWKYVCGYCGYNVASSQGFFTEDQEDGNQGFIYICPNCTRPTFMHGTKRMPGVAPGNPVEHLPLDIEALYNEARQAVAVNAFTAAVLACRKLLMNIAVNHGAKENQSFVSYVEYLANAGFVPPNGRAWVDHIRAKGNEATHEIRLMSRSEAGDLISFAEMLLKFIYEFPNKLPAQP